MHTPKTHFNHHKFRVRPRHRSPAKLTCLTVNRKKSEKKRRATLDPSADGVLGPDWNMAMGPSPQKRQKKTP